MKKNPFEKSLDNKRYYTQNYYLRKRFGSKVIKLSLNAGLSCPNRDGTKGSGGCTYCSESLSGDFAGNPENSITAQLSVQKNMLSSKWGEGLYIPYFQSGTNTYTSPENLRSMCSEALSFEKTVGLAIATRADCIDENIADILAEFSEKTYLTLELGLQTIHDKTAQRINRCHTYDDFLKAYDILKSRNINVCIHIINGLPFETHDMMLETASEISRLKPHSIKIHMLHILKNTVMEKEYLNGQIQLLSLEEYVNTVCDQLEIINPDIIIQRVTGDGSRDSLIAPLWTLKKFVVMNEIDKELSRRNSWQGKFCKQL